MTEMLSDAALYQWIGAICAATGELPDPALLPGERMALSGPLFPEARELVLRVAHAVAQEPALFPDVAVDPAAMRERALRGLAFQRLGRLLGRLSQQALDCALIDSSTAVKDALAVVEQVRTTGRLPFPFPRQRRREMALLPAEQVLKDRQRRQRRAAARNLKRKERDPEAEHKEKLSPQREAMIAAQRAAPAEGMASLLPDVVVPPSLRAEARSEQQSESPGQANLSRHLLNVPGREDCHSPPAIYSKMAAVSTLPRRTVEESPDASPFMGIHPWPRPYWPHRPFGLQPDRDRPKRR